MAIRLLDVPVDQVMTSSPAAIEPEATLGEAAGRMVEGGFRHLPVVDASERLVGMLSDRDLRERLGVEVERFPDAPNGLLEEQVERAMRPDPVTLDREQARLRDVLEVLGDERIGAIPVTDAREHVVGIVSYIDVLQFLREQDVVLAIRRPDGRARRRAPSKRSVKRPARRSRRARTRRT